MKKVSVEDAFWEIFPEAQINILVVKNIDNHVYEKNTPYFTKLLKQAAKEAEQFLGDENFSSNQVVAQWRDGFSQFKTKKGARSSIEALLKRVSQQREFQPINPLVDIYNSISLKYGVPSGGEDIDKIEGSLYLGKAKGGESFLPLGAEKDAPALPEEIIYYDDEGAICRCLNWREAQRTMLTEETKAAVLVIESINEEQSKRADKAVIELKELVDAYFNSESTIYKLSQASAEAILE
ncbi:B3/B4 domain-containing protein [Enterococcus sp. LJL128]|uniref:B3/B4 domain-containing protein n=1 Tax=Enterococcus sp. LJL51 TaxID=3416656 RepID=UPI003CE8991C